jgi:hypothetical protein
MDEMCDDKIKPHALEDPGEARVAVKKELAVERVEHAT